MVKHNDDVLIERLDNLKEGINGIHQRLDTLNGKVASHEGFTNQQIVINRIVIWVGSILGGLVVTLAFKTFI